MKDGENVINFSDKPHRKDKNFLSGFSYVKTKKNLDGKLFNPASLLKYADKCKYLVSIMKKEDGTVYLYRYLVPHGDLANFLYEVQKEDFDGDLIEVEKYVPEDLA